MFVWKFHVCITICTNFLTSRDHYKLVAEMWWLEEDGGGGASRKKNWLRNSGKYAHLHSMSFITKKFREILLSCFRGVALKNCFSSISFILAKFLSSKRGITPRKKIKISCGYAHLHIMSFITTKKFVWAISEELR